MSKVESLAPRSVRNNNPGNIVTGDAWQGIMSRDDMTPEQTAEKRFVVFKTPVWGFRALGIVLLNYQHKHNLHTIRQMIDRWAPSVENDTEAYIDAVARACGHSADAPIDLTIPDNLRGMAGAIAVHEAGGWYFNNADLAAGIDMAETAA